MGDSPIERDIHSHHPHLWLSTVRDNVATALVLAPPHIFRTLDARCDSSTKPIITGAMADKEIKEGDEVSWQWSGGRPGGVASEVKEQGEITMETKRGNEVKKNAEPDNPAVKVDREGHDVVKKASELEVEEEGPNHKEDGDKQDDKKDEENKDEEKKDEDKNEADGEEKKDSEEPQAGEKRKADDKRKADESESKKAKKDEGEPKENGEKPAPKKKGRPAKNGGAAKETKKKEPKRAATESGQPRRSGRNASK